MGIWGGARCIAGLGISTYGKHCFSDLNLHVSQSSDRLPDRMLWVDGNDARRAKKNKDKLQGIIMVGFSPVRGGLHKFDVHSFILSTNINYWIYAWCHTVTDWNTAVNKMDTALAIKNMEVTQSSVGKEMNLWAIVKIIRY